MTGEKSRKLVAGDRVFWQSDVKNQGTVKGTSWSSVTIDWDDGDSTSISHNDMAQVPGSRTRDVVAPGVIKVEDHIISPTPGPALVAESARANFL
jgi:hypothetical protein